MGAYDFGIEGKPVADLGSVSNGQTIGASFFGHAYLVHKEKVWRGGPTFDSPLDFGPIAVEYGVPIAQSEDVRIDSEGQLMTPQQRGHISLIPYIGDRRPADVINIMDQLARQLDNPIVQVDAGIDYSPLLPPTNSNATVRAMLHLVGINMNDVLPDFQGLSISYPGSSQDLGISYKIIGTARPDKIYGESGSQVYSGGGGNDRLKGGADNDALHGGNGDKDTALFSGNCREYEFKWRDDGYLQVAHIGGDKKDGVDILKSVEIGQFKNGKVDLTVSNPGCVPEVGIIIDDHVLQNNRAAIDRKIKALMNDYELNFHVYRDTVGSSDTITYRKPFKNATQELTESEAWEQIKNHDWGYDYGVKYEEGDLTFTIAGALPGRTRFKPVVETYGVEGSTFEHTEKLIVITNDAPLPWVTGQLTGEHIVKLANATNTDIDVVVAGGAGGTSKILADRTGGVSYNSLDAWINNKPNPKETTGSSSNDKMVGTGGHDRMFGAAGDDIISGRNGNDTLRGGTGKDTLLGETGADRIAGEGGSDSLRGGNGDDVIDGGAGKDAIRGGAGNDTLFGRSGADVFLFHPLAPGSDIIRDYEEGLDRIGLEGGLKFSALDFSATSDGLQVIAKGFSALLPGIQEVDELDFLTI